MLVAVCDLQRQLGCDASRLYKRVKRDGVIVKAGGKMHVPEEYARQCIAERDAKAAAMAGPLLTSHQVALILNVSMSTMCILARDRRLPSVKILGGHRFKPEDVAAFVERGADSEHLPQGVNRRHWKEGG